MGGFPGRKDEQAAHRKVGQRPGLLRFFYGILAAWLTGILPCAAAWPRHPQSIPKGNIDSLMHKEAMNDCSYLLDRKEEEGHDGAQSRPAQGHITTGVGGSPKTPRIPSGCGSRPISHGNHTNGNGGEASA